MSSISEYKSRSTIDVIALYFYLNHFILHEFTFASFKPLLSLRVDIARKGGEKEKCGLIGLSVMKGNRKRGKRKRERKGKS